MAEKAAAKKVTAKKVTAEKVATENATAEKVMAEKAIAKKVATEKATACEKAKADAVTIEVLLKRFMIILPRCSDKTSGSPSSGRSPRKMNLNLLRSKKLPAGK